MKKVTLTFLLLAGFFVTQLSAQCACGFYQSLAPSQAVGNCHQYVRAYFKDGGGHYGEWIPPSNFNYSIYPSTAIYNDPDFVETCNPNDAQVVFYPCDHSAVFTSNTCLISKAGFTSEYGRHGIGGAGCGTTGLRFFKYKWRSSSDQADASCNFTVNTTACPVNCQPPATPTDIYISSPSGCNWIVSTYAVTGATSYTWSGYGTFTTPAGPTLSPGGYSLAVRANNSCGSSAWYTEHLEVPRSPWCGGGMGYTGENAVFSLSPNPADQEVLLNLSGNHENTQIFIINTLGQVMTLVDAKDSAQWRFDVSGYQNGLYVMQVRQNGQVIQTEKIMVQH